MRIDFRSITAFSVLTSTASAGMAVPPGVLDLSTGPLTIAPQPTALSPDGLTVVGQINEYHNFDPAEGNGFRFRIGTTSVSTLPTMEAASIPAACSGDGSVIVGTVAYSDAVAAYQAAIWRTGLPQLLDAYSSAYAVSFDGTVVVGAQWTLPTDDEQAFRWTASTGMVSLGVLPGDTFSAAYGVSADGNVIVGGSSTSSSSRPFLWTPTSGLQVLGPPDATTSSRAIACSFDGSVVLIDAETANGRRAFIWSAATGFSDLGTVAGFPGTWPTAMSGDGSTVVGILLSGTDTAFLWTQSDGIRTLSDVTNTYQSFVTPTGVNGDGSVVVVDNSVVVLRSIGCDGDFNQDGRVTIQDLFDFLDAYLGNCQWSIPSCPHNAFWHAPGVNSVYKFLAAWSAGCN